MLNCFTQVVLLVGVSTAWKLSFEFVFKRSDLFSLCVDDFAHYAHYEFVAGHFTRLVMFCWGHDSPRALARTLLILLPNTVFLDDNDS